MQIIVIGKDGWPVELIKGRWFMNILRRIIHGRKLEFHFDKGVLCEGCDKCLRDDEGNETDDMVMLCDECWEGCKNDPDCHAEECDCSLCAPLPAPPEPKP